MEKKRRKKKYRSSKSVPPRKRQQKKSHQSHKRKKSRKQESPLLDWLVSILVILVFSMMFVIYLKIDRAEVISGSMEPTLMTNEKVLIINDKTPTHFQIVVFSATKDSKEKFVKRVIGLPGDRVEYRGDHLFLNGETYEEPYLAENKRIFYSKEEATHFYTADFQLGDIPGVKEGIKEIPQGMYLVLGDNRQNSQDSRYIGLISKADLVGVLWQKNK